MNVNKIVLILLIAFAYGCQEKNIPVPDGIYYSYNNHSLVRFQNDSLTLIEDSLSGICETFVLNNGIYKGITRGASVYVLNKGSKILVRKENSNSNEYVHQIVPKWDSIQLLNKRRKTRWTKLFDDKKDGQYSDSDIACIISLKKIQMTPIQTTDQNPLQMMLFKDGEIFTSEGSVNWICLDVFNPS